jgi:hypothetical protein
VFYGWHRYQIGLLCNVNGPGVNYSYSAVAAEYLWSHGLAVMNGLFILVLQSSNPGCATFLDFTSLEYPIVSYSILIDSGVLLSQLFRVRVENFLFGCPLLQYGSFTYLSLYHDFTAKGKQNSRKNESGNWRARRYRY